MYRHQEIRPVGGILCNLTMLVLITDLIRKEVAKIAQQMPDGFTFNLFTNRIVTRGYAVASVQTQDCFGKQGLFRVIKFCLSHSNYCVGGWKNEDGTMQYDASIIYTDIQDAISAAVLNSQRAIFNLYTGREIRSCDYYKYVSCAFAA